MGSPAGVACNLVKSERFACRPRDRKRAGSIMGAGGSKGNLSLRINKGRSRDEGARAGPTLRRLRLGTSKY